MIFRLILILATAWKDIHGHMLECGAQMKIHIGSGVERLN
jgi:hypothetical protein